jgi:glycosyltransferase involved in cell wall biosynthesis
VPIPEPVTSPGAEPWVLAVPSLDTVVAGGRGADFQSAAASALVLGRPPALAPRSGEPSPHLHICMLVPRTDVGGGARVLFEHANRLVTRGHRLTLLSHLPAPDWTTVLGDFRHVPVGTDLVDAIPPCDLVVCGYWDHVAAARAASVAPVVHFEQGDFHLFEEIDDGFHRVVQANLHAADLTTTVSTRVAAVLADRFALRDAEVVHNAIDPAVFHPDPSAQTRHGGPSTAEHGYLICVGWDGNHFKGIDDIRRVWDRISAARSGLRLVWVTPRPPCHGPLGDVVVNPPQHELADLYRGAIAYVCASHYESFPLPPLEAMACGTPVVTTANEGALEYARHEENALVVPVGDVDAMAAALCRIVDEPDTASRLRAGGLRTAAQFTWDASIDTVERHYRTLSRWEIPRRGPAGWVDVVTPDRADPEARHRLAVAKETTDAREILVPVSRPTGGGLRVASWEVVTRRADGAGSLRVLAPHRLDEPVCTVSYWPAIRALAAGRAAAAFDALRSAFETARTPAEQGALGKWLALALLALGHADEAQAVIVAGLADFPDNPDYLCLAARAATIHGWQVDHQAVLAAVRLIGPGTRYTDWFDDPVAMLASDRLLGATGRAPAPSAR